MPEIYNLSTLCRCCHADGSFKSLNLLYRVRNTVEMYETMLLDTLGVKIQEPPLDASYTICNKCILKLRQASNFKKQVMLCEQKFIEYCRNEQFQNTAPELKVEIKTEFDTQEEIDNENTAHTEEDNNYNDLSVHKQELKADPEVAIEYSDEISGAEDNITTDVKEEKDLHNTIDNQETISKEDQANTKDEKKRDNDESETQALDIDTSYIIETETEKGLQYSCKECSGVHYNNIKQIHRHLYTNHDTLKCKYCDKQLKTFVTFDNHVKTHFDKKFQCTMCDKKYHFKAALNVHLNTHTKAKIFICDICKKQYTSKTILKRHIFWHLGLNKKKLCELCGRSFNDSTNLKIHIRTVHEKLRPFKCDVCSKTFTAKKHLKSHQLKHDNTEFNCDLCHRKYSTLQSMKLHRLSHDNIFKCKHCSKKFNGRDTLKLHMNTSHSSVNLPVPCDECGKILSSRNTLRRHLNEHFGKKYPCNICGRIFAQKGAMLRHKTRLHTEKIEKSKTKCLICNKSFNNIASHMRSHDDRKYSCDMCSKTYPGNNTLTRHKLQVHFGRSFACEVCGKKYLQKSKLNTHKLKVHKLKTEANTQDNVENAG